PNMVLPLLSFLGSLTSCKQRILCQQMVKTHHKLLLNQCIKETLYILCYTFCLPHVSTIQRPFYTFQNLWYTMESRRHNWLKYPICCQYFLRFFRSSLSSFHIVF